MDSMLNQSFFGNAFIWFFTSVLLFGICVTLPIRIKNDALRNWVMRWMLVPISVIIIVYVYPVGIEVFRRLAIK